MIHGNVGTGQSFSDSSPSKHTITANGNVTHSGGQSKFSGGSIYFDGTGDYLDVAASTGFAFGTGDFTVLYCMVLYCCVLYGMELYCIVLYCVVSYCIVL